MFSQASKLRLLSLRAGPFVLLFVLLMAFNPVSAQITNLDEIDEEDIDEITLSKGLSHERCCSSGQDPCKAYQISQSPIPIFFYYAEQILKKVYKDILWVRLVDATLTPVRVVEVIKRDNIKKRWKSTVSALDFLVTEKWDYLPANKINRSAYRLMWKIKPQPGEEKKEVYYFSEPFELHGTNK